MNNQQLVREFQLTAEQPVSDTPRKLTTKGYEFRRELQIEELNETEKAIKANDRVEIADGIGDQTYVFLGTANEIGVDHSEDILRFELDYEKPHHYTVNGYLTMLRGLIYDYKTYTIDTERALHLVYRLSHKLGFTLDQFNEIFRRVHASNMTKFATSYADADKTIKQYADKGIETYCVQNGPRYAILRTSDKKVMKAWNYSPVDLTAI